MIVELPHIGRSTAPRRISAVMIRHGYATIRTPHRFFDFGIWPVVDTIFYSSIAKYAQGAGASASTRATLLVAAGIVMWHVVYQSQLAVSTGFFEEVNARQLPSLLATPLRPVEWLAGAALQGLVKVAIGVSAVSLTAAVLYHFNVTTTGVAMLPVMALLLLTGWALALLVIGVVMFLGSGTEMLTFGLLFVLLPLSGAFYSTSALPAACRPISAVLPTTYTFRAARAVAGGDPSPWSQIGIAAVGTGALIVAVQPAPDG